MPQFASLLQADSQVDEVILFDKKLWKKISKLPENLRQIRKLAKIQFDYVLDLQSLARSAIFAWLCRGKKIIGLDDRREFAPFFHHYSVPRPTPDTHAVDWYLQVLPLMGIPQETSFEWLPVNRKVQNDLLETFPQLFKFETHRIAIQPCTRWLSKEWPVNNFVETIKQLAKQHPDYQISILGSNSEIPIAEQIINAVSSENVVNLCGKFSLPELVEWIRSVDFFLTADTGPMHIAAALKKTMIALFGPTSHFKTGPYHMLDSVIHPQLPCVPCMKSVCKFTNGGAKCMNLITPQVVVDKINQMLQK